MAVVSVAPYCMNPTNYILFPIDTCSWFLMSQTVVVDQGVRGG